MASIKIKFRPSGIAGHEGSLVFQIIHKRLVRQLPAGYRVFAWEWDERRADVVVPAQTARREYLYAVRDGLRHSAARLQQTVRALEGGAATYSADDVIARYERMLAELSLTRFMEKGICRLRNSGKARTAETYATALRSFREFLAQRGDRG